MDWICSALIILSIQQLELSTGQLYEVAEEPLDTNIRSKRVSTYSVVETVGDDARTSEFPHLAAIGFMYRFKQYWLCGGTLISKRFVLTAAHCLGNTRVQKYGKAVNVRLGDEDLKDISDNHYAQVIDVKRRIPHPQYHYPLKYNDIGLLELKQDAVFNNFVKPACLHKTHDIKESKAIVLGWSTTEAGATPGYQKLKEVEIVLHPIDHCTKMEGIDALIRDVQLSQGLLDDSMICAGVIAGGKDSCTVDSGGPLEVSASSAQCSAEIIGITSFVLGSCGKLGIPTIYTRVSKYASWIESIISSSS